MTIYLTAKTAVSEKDKRKHLRSLLESLIVDELSSQRKQIGALREEVAKFRQVKQLLK